MPDLMPNTSIYPHPQQQQPMSLGDLVGIAKGLQDLQNRQSMGEAIKRNLDPNAPGGVNYQGARQYYGRNAPAPNPDDMAATTEAEAAGYKLRLSQTQTAVDALSSIVDLPNLSKDDFYRISPLLTRAGIPPNIVSGIIASAPEGGPELKTQLTTLQNWLSQAARTSVPGPPNPITGAPNVVPGSAAALAQRGLGAGPGGTGVPGMPTGLPPGTEPVMIESGKLYAQHLSEAANYRREVLPLEQAIPALSRLGKTGTGPGTDEFNQIKSFLQSAGAGTLLGIDPSKIKDFDEAKKYLTDWVMATGSTGTNDKLAAAFASNANVGISNAAATDVAKTALTVRRMKQAQVSEFTATGQPEGSYSKWALNWNKSQDPRAFGFDLLTRDQAAKMLKSMTPEERKRFLASKAIAERNQLTSPQGGWNYGE